MGSTELEIRDAYEAHADRLDDLTLLSTIEDGSIAAHLTSRHAAGEMYTAIGDVLIAVNPYSKLSKAGLSTYDPKVAWHFAKTEKLGLVPHIFHVAADAYGHLRERREDTCILVTGESGAGKTESAKHIMQFVTVVSPESTSSRFGGTNGEVRRVEQVKSQLLNSSPLLESLGNAKTSRNDNSSRFGKYLELQFDYAGGVVGGKVTSYLLEKSRVIGHAEAERGFHIFSQFCLGAYRPTFKWAGDTFDENTNKQEKNLYCAPMIKAEEFRYMMNLTKKVEGMDDEAMGREVEEAMLSVGMQKDDRSAIGRILGGILALGNITFEHMDGDSGGSQVTKASQSWLQSAADAFGVSSESLAIALTTHALVVGGQTNLKHLGSDESANNTDTLAKETYKRLFDWVIAQVNKGTDVSGFSSGDGKGRDFLCVGVLDIYGFEILGTNGFEQLCINFVNEKLQQLAIALTLKGEQEEYAAEGIGWVDIAYIDNQPVVSLIENQRGGLLALLDEACTFRNASAATFASSITRAFNLDKPSKDALVTAPKNKRGQESFCVKHYAGEVLYNYEGFVEKNEDSLYHDLVDCLSASSCDQLSSMFPVIVEDGKSRKRPPSVSLQFKRQVNELVTTLSRCKPHYVRCVKPNSTKSPLTAETDLMVHQVQYLGLTETVKVRRAGFCLRLPFVRFLRRYSLVSGHKDVWPLNSNVDAAELCRLVLCSGEVAKHRPFKLDPIKLEAGVDFVIGKTKVFIKAPKTVFLLEAQRAVVLPYLATDINKIARGKVARMMLAASIRKITLVSAQARRLNTLRAYRKTRLTLLALATCMRKFLAKARVAKLRVQFKNKPPRTYALIIQKRFRGNRGRMELSELIREQCRMCAYRAKYSKAIRDIQCAFRCSAARYKLKRHLNARKIENLMRCAKARMVFSKRKEEDFDEVIMMLTKFGYDVYKHPSSKADSKKDTFKQPANGAAAAIPNPKPSEGKKLPGNIKPKKIFLEKRPDGRHDMIWDSDAYFRSKNKIPLRAIVGVLKSKQTEPAFAKTGHEAECKKYLCFVHNESGKNGNNKYCALEFESEWHRDKFLRTIKRVGKEEKIQVFSSF